MGRPVQPARERAVFPDRAGLPRQDQEGHLEGVLGVVRVVQDAPADAQHHRPVPLHQRAEGRLAGLVAARHEPFQQLGVGQPADRPDPEQRLEMPEQLARSPASHAAVTPLTWPGLCVPRPGSTRPAGRQYNFFGLAGTRGRAGSSDPRRQSACHGRNVGVFSEMIRSGSKEGHPETGMEVTR